MAGVDYRVFMDAVNAVTIGLNSGDVVDISEFNHLITAHISATKRVKTCSIHHRDNCAMCSGKAGE
jgi:hypothetical protein